MKRKTTNLIGVCAFGVFGIAVLISLGIDTYRQRKVAKQIEALAEMFAARNDEALVAWNNRELRDPWGTEVEYEDENDQVRVISAGPDRAIKTSDDIASKWHGKKRSSKIVEEVEQLTDDIEEAIESIPVEESFWSKLKSKIWGEKSP